MPDIDKVTLKSPAAAADFISYNLP